MPKMPFTSSATQAATSKYRDRWLQLESVLIKTVGDSVGPQKGRLGGWEVLAYGGSDPFMEVSVPSSNTKDTYGVVVSRSGVVCQCKSYEYRKACKHSKIVSETVGLSKDET